MSGTGATPLLGFTVGLTADRRREDLANLLTRHGARVVIAPAIRIVTLPDDAGLLRATWACLSGRLDDVVVTTGIGFRGWLEAADGWGLGEALRAQLGKARLLTRGPKARGAVRAAGLVDAWSPESESMDELAGYLLSASLAGRRVAVQLHGEPLPDMTAALRAHGAEVVEVPVYRWAPAHDLDPVRRLIGRAVAGGLDALAFTSAPAVVSTLRVAAEIGAHDVFVTALRTRVLAACVGPVCAGPLLALDVPVVQPQRARLGALARTIVDELPPRARRFAAAGHQIELRGHVAVVDGNPVTLAAGPAAVLHTLAEHPGHVLARGQLATRTGTALGEAVGVGIGVGLKTEPANGHAVEMAVGRLRAALGPAGNIVQTVVKRGYRLAP